MGACAPLWLLLPIAPPGGRLPCILCCHGHGQQKQLVGGVSCLHAAGATHKPVSSGGGSLAHSPLGAETIWDGRICLQLKNTLHLLALQILSSLNNNNQLRWIVGTIWQPSWTTAWGNRRKIHLLHPRWSNQLLAGKTAQAFLTSKLPGNCLGLLFLNSGTEGLGESVHFH